MIARRLHAAIVCGAMFALFPPAAPATAAVRVFSPRDEPLVAVQRPGFRAVAVPK